MIPARFAPVVFGLILSGLMSCMVSGVVTFRVIDGDLSFFGAWMSSWLYSWSVAFSTVLLVAPVTRRIVARLVAVP
jgi:hypothetical protein